MIGERLRALRRSKNMRPVDLAHASGILRASIANIEGGHAGVSLDMLFRLAGGLGVGIADLLGDQPIVQTPAREIHIVPPAAPDNLRAIDEILIALRSLRQDACLTQPQLAELSGIGMKTISSFESGRRIESMKVIQLQRLVNALGMTLLEFFAHVAKAFESEMKKSA